MIDLHTHVLPGIDDGAESLDDSLEMLRAALAGGTTDLVATPHADGHFDFDRVTASALLETVRAAAGPNAPKLHLGCELHLTHERVLAVVADPSSWTLAGKNYLLLELPDPVLPGVVDDVIARFRAEGLRPIIAHPERNSLAQQSVHVARKWVEQGAYIQLTAGAVVGRYGRRAASTARSLLKAELAHFIASDAHHPDHRPALLGADFAWVTDKFGRAVAEALFRDNPAAVLEGRDLPLQPVRRGWTCFNWIKRTDSTVTVP